MKKCLGVIALLLLSIPSYSQVFITEIADPVDVTTARYVELYNAGSTDVDLNGWILSVFFNANTTAGANNQLSGIIPAGGFFLLAENAGAFSSAYSLTADQDGSVNSNGDDNFELRDDTGTLVDVFGIPGQDGTNSCHEFEDGRVERKATVTSGSTTWDEAEWNEWSDGAGSGCTDYTTLEIGTTDGIFDPGAWIGAGPASTCTATLEFGFADCNAITSAADTYDAAFDFLVGSETDVFTVSASVGTPDVTTVTGDEIVIVSNAPEGSDIILTMTNTNCTLTATAPAPNCQPLPTVAITEISYNTVGADDEWIEICNTGSDITDISGMEVLDDGTSRFTFDSGTTIGVGECITLSLGASANPAYNLECPFVPDFGVAPGTDMSNVLSNSAATISLVLGSTDLDVVSYDDGDGADSNGSTLHVIDIAADNSTTSVNWTEVGNGGSAGINALNGPCGPQNTILQWTATSASIDEDGLFATACVSILNPDPVNQTDVFVIFSGTARDTTDFQNVNTGIPFGGFTALTFPAGDGSSQCIDIEILDDMDFEGTESATFTLLAPSGGNAVEIGENSAFTLVINDNDAPVAQPCTDLFISEYIEGSSSNKCVEIYNPSSAPVDMDAAGYALYSYNNGSISPTDTVDLMGTLAPGEVYVVCTDMASSDFSSEADLTLSFPSVVHFNGDDAISLVKGADIGSVEVIVDVIGVIGTDPGTEWTGLGGCSTNNTTLVRKSTIQQGDGNGSDAFDPSVEWDCFAQDTADDLGGHTSDCIVSNCTITAVNDGGVEALCDAETNVYSQNITVTYTDAPAFGTLDVNGQSFAIGTSPQTVILTSLLSDGLDVDVTASFSADGACEFSASALFTAPESCLPENTLLINEFDYDQASTDTEEYLEIYNAGELDVNLSDYSVVLVNGSNDGVYATLTFDAQTLAAGEYYVFCFGANLSAYCDQSEPSIMSFQNGPDAIGLIRSGLLVDAVSYEGEVTGYAEGTATVSDGETNSLSRIPNGIDTDDNNADFQSVCLTPGESNRICPINDQCEGAIDIPLSIFGGAPGSVQFDLTDASANEVCEGTGDKVLWFSFVPETENDFLLAGVANVFGPEVGSGFDAVVQVYEECGGEPIGCYNNYGPNTLERVHVGGLTPGQTYYYSVHTFGDASSITSGVFYTAARTFADHNLRDAFCDVTNYTLNSVVQAERDDFNEIYVATGVPVSGYGFRFEQDGAVVSEVFQPAFDGFYIRLADVGGLSYGETYDVSVSHSVRLSANGAIIDIRGDYGGSCTIGLDALPTTSLRADYCDGATEYFLAENIQANILTGATDYEFIFNDGDNIIVKPSSNYSLHLYTVNGLQYGTSYTVTVRANIEGQWTEEGPACTLIMAAQPENASLQAVSCNGVYEYPSSEVLLSDFILGAELYEFQFTQGLGSPISRINPDLSLTLNSTLGIEPGTYDVAVRVFAGGVWGDFSASCPVTLGNDNLKLKVKPTTTLDSAFDFVVYPNPTEADEFRIDLTSEQSAGAYQVSLLDITGKEVARTLIVSKGGAVSKVMDISKIESGLYMVRVTKGDSVTTKRLVVSQR